MELNIFTKQHFPRIFAKRSFEDVDFYGRIFSTLRFHGYCYCSAMIMKFE